MGALFLSSRSSWNLFKKINNKTTSGKTVEGALWLTVEVVSNIHSSLDLYQIVARNWSLEDHYILLIMSLNEMKPNRFNMHASDSHGSKLAQKSIVLLFALVPFS